jgi:hypothetical protein
VLRAMVADLQPDDLVVPLVLKVGKHRLARKFREHLLLTKSCREEVFKETSTHEMIGFRALRNTYCTWSAIEVRELAKVRKRVGHEGVDMTLKYYREVEDRPQLRGTAFPSLDAIGGAPKGGLADTTEAARGTVAARPEASKSDLGPDAGPKVGQVTDIIVEAPGIEPGSENLYALPLHV